MSRTKPLPASVADDSATWAQADNPSPTVGAVAVGYNVETTGPVTVTQPLVTGAAKTLDQAIDKILQAQRLNDDLQKQYTIGSAAWHQCETIDDHLHDALALLGA